MERTNKPIDEVTFSELQDFPAKRIRKVDWDKVLTQLDTQPGVWGLVGEFDQSMRTHINKGRFSYIDPALYEAAARKINGHRANIYIRRRLEGT